MTLPDMAKKNEYFWKSVEILKKYHNEKNSVGLF